MTKISNMERNGGEKKLMDASSKKGYNPTISTLLLARLNKIRQKKYLSYF